MKARLMVADSERDANMLYATRLFVPDPFIWLAVRGKSYAVMSDLEIDRARKQAAVDRVVAKLVFLCCDDEVAHALSRATQT